MFEITNQTSEPLTRRLVGFSDVWILSLPFFLFPGVNFKRLDFSTRCLDFQPYVCIFFQTFEISCQAKISLAQKGQKFKPEAIERATKTRDLCQATTQPYKLFDTLQITCPNIQDRIFNDFDFKTPKLENSPNQFKSKANEYEQMLGIHT